jgi:hypothetical protein
MDLREGMATMSMTGESLGRSIPGVNPRVVEYLALWPNLFISAHLDYVMTHRMLPLAPNRTSRRTPDPLSPRRRFFGSFSGVSRHKRLLDRSIRYGCSSQALLQVVEPVVQMSSQVVELGPQLEE